MAAQQINKNLGNARPVAWEALRPRLYKAVRATVMAGETPAARRNLLERWLTTLFREDTRQVTFPEELAEAQQAFFQTSLERAVNRCRGYAGAWFVWDNFDQKQLRREAEKAVNRVAQADERAQAILKADVLKAEDFPALLRYRLRQHWCGPAEAPETFRVEAWLQEVGFFSRELMEISSWAHLFHATVLLHREGLQAPDDRLSARHSVLDKVNNGQPLDSIPELVLYLEEQIRAPENVPAH
ncbi:MAG TPA: hypothetical protein VE082_03960, partial [Desulfobaccales bacterium]|nr:hypothetical protein [Desulfobaccales bacterium]